MVISINKYYDKYFVSYLKYMVEFLCNLLVWLQFEAIELKFHCIICNESKE